MSTVHSPASIASIRRKSRFRHAVVASLLVPLAAFVLSGCAAVLNAATSGDGYSVVDDIRYMPGERGTYDLYIPATVSPKTPVVVFLYGGGWDSGSKDMYLFVGQSLASEGVIVAIPDYRHYPQVRFPGFIEDAAKATARIARTVRGGAYAMPGGPHPLFLMGHSAGAEIAGLLATDETWLAQERLSSQSLAGFIGLAGPYDFLPLTEERYKAIFPEEQRAASQPINFIDGGESPMLLIAGEDDTTVSPKNTRSLAAKMRASGGSVTETIYPDVDHLGAITAFATAIPLNDTAIRDQTLDFIRKNAR
ncbi:alpha/beta hydrolase [Aurantimonas marina]|uniref:alpha/beta hydrolase n=1 Tax=Aurantimonas marina TaxID=2780508 RepID=UPI0019D195EC|nr:alpha/beta hydrolase [Aurantimonas marina]